MATFETRICNAPGRCPPHTKSYSSGASIGSGSFAVGGSGIRSGYGYSLGTGLGGGLQSQAGFGLGSGLGLGVGVGGGSRFGAGLAVGGGRFGLGLASGGGGGGRFGFGLAAGGGGGGGAGGGAGFWAGGNLDGGLIQFSPNEKLELQTLNDRLAIYLDKVKRLETANRELEEKLRGFKANKVQVTYDMQAYEARLQPLRDQLTEFLKGCSHIALLIDNAKLAADDYRMRYENELTMRQAAESDVTALKTLRREYDLTTTALTQEYQILLKDRDTLKNTHEQEVLSLRGQMAGTLTVDVQVGTSVDLSHRLTDLRAEYETIVEKNHREIENWYTGKLEVKDQHSLVVTEGTVTGSAEIATSRTQILTLQTDLDGALLQKNQLEQRLVEIQGQNQMQLLTFSRLAGGLEGELTSMRDSALQQAREYQLLLSTKMQLEREIATYKSLLEYAGDLSKFPGIGIPKVWASPAPSVDLRSRAAQSVPVNADAGEGAGASADAVDAEAVPEGGAVEGTPPTD